MNCRILFGFYSNALIHPDRSHHVEFPILLPWFPVFLFWPKLEHLYCTPECNLHDVLLMKNLLSPAEVLKRAAWKENGLSKRIFHGISPTFNKWSINALNTQTTGSLHDLFLLLVWFRATTTTSALLYPQQQSIIVTCFDVALYCATENTFFLKVSFSFIEYIFPSLQGFVLNLLCLLVYFVNRITATFNSLHPKQHFSLKARATWVSRKQCHSDIFCPQRDSSYSTKIDVGSSSDLFDSQSPLLLA